MGSLKPLSPSVRIGNEHPLFTYRKFGFHNGFPYTAHCIIFVIAGSGREKGSIPLYQHSSVQSINNEATSRIQNRERLLAMTTDVVNFCVWHHLGTQWRTITLWVNSMIIHPKWFFLMPLELFPHASAVKGTV